ncbi:MAG: FxsA family protein [Pseudomonadota bacterium]|nr:FxsA family protein [Pseudomonadota bacterium]
MWLFVLFIAVPLIEIALFIQVGGAIGLWATLAIVVITALIGTNMMRAQGSATMRDIKGSFNDMRDPSEPLAHGAMILFSGALLLTPGFFTDTVGFLLLIPAFRRAAFKWLKSRIKVQTFETHTTYQSRPTPRDPDVIEGEFREVDQTNKGDNTPSGWTRH